MLVGDKKYRKYPITFEEYFELEDGEKPSIEDSCPRYCHLSEYLDVAKNQIMFIYLYIRINNRILINKQTFWNNGANSVVEVIEKSPTPYRILIFSMLSKKRPETYEVIRIHIEKDKVVPSYHGFIREINNSENLVDLGNLKNFISWTPLLYGEIDKT